MAGVIADAGEEPHGPEEEEEDENGSLIHIFALDPQQKGKTMAIRELVREGSIPTTTGI